MALDPLTDRQQKVFDFVREYARGHGFPPTLREIGDAVGINNLNAVRGHLAALEKKGRILKSPDKARSIQILEEKEKPPEPSALSRFKRVLHKVLHTDEGVVHRLVYGVAWVTAGWDEVLIDEVAEAVAEALEREAAERGWTLYEKHIEPDCVMVVVGAWPNHAPDKIVRRLQQATRSAVQKELGILAKLKVWGPGYVVTTEIDSLEELAKGLSPVSLVDDLEDDDEP